jgi:TolA-binding protein
VLRDFIEKNRGNDNRPEALYLLITSLMQLDLSQDAVAALRILEKDHGRSEYRFRAQVDAAKILADKELYQESLNVYQRLSNSRIPENVRFDVLTGMARVQEQLGDYQAALATLGQIQKAPPGVDKEPTLILLRAKAYAGIDSTQRAIYSYQDVTKRFGRGTFGAEAYFNLGELYESMDSLEAAQRSYDEVPRAYSGSEHANEAIKRSGNISRVLKLQATSGDDSPEAVSLRTFSMAEIQLFQFNNAEKAAENYQKIVTEFPESEYAPRAVYALGYISGVVQGDTAKAREWYDILRNHYPDSEQTKLAIAFYKGAIPPPPYSEMMKTATVLKPATPTRGRPEPPRRQPPKPTPTDTTRTAPPPQPADAQPAGPTPSSTAPKDTTAAPEDSTRGSN